MGYKEESAATSRAIGCPIRLVRLDFGELGGESAISFGELWAGPCGRPLSAVCELGGDSAISFDKIVPAGS